MNLDSKENKVPNQRLGIEISKKRKITSTKDNEVNMGYTKRS